MGRPWWYDSYWQKKKPQRRRPSFTRRGWAWVALAAVALFLAGAGAGFRPSIVAWLLGFVNYFCRILAVAVLIRAILSWFRIRGYSLALVVLDDLTEPILSPLRRTIRPFGGLDLTPLIATVILYAIPSVFTRLVTLLVP